MTLTEEEWEYKDRPGSWSRDLDGILAQTESTNGVSKLIVMGKAKLTVKTTTGDNCYRVTFHETWTRIE